MMKLHLVALDQLARLLHAGADVVGRILDQQLELAAENAALGVDLLDRELGADHLVLRDRGVDAGQRIDHADLDGGLAARLDDEGRRDLRGTDGGAGLEQGAAVNAIRKA